LAQAIWLKFYAWKQVFRVSHSAPIGHCCFVLSLRHALWFEQMRFWGLEFYGLYAIYGWQDGA